MSIVCPNCNTSFTIPIGKIGVAGRKVKCSKCQHIWHQKISCDDEISSDHSTDSPKSATDSSISEHKNISDINNSDRMVFLERRSNLPVIPPRKALNLEKSLSCVLTILLILFFSLVIFHQRFAISFWKESEKNLIIHDLSATRNEDETVKILGKIINNSDNMEILIPLIKIKFLTKDHKLSKSYFLDQNNILLGPKQKIIISTNLSSNLPFDEISIMVGNRFDFFINGF